MRLNSITCNRSDLYYMTLIGAGCIGNFKGIWVNEGFLFYTHCRLDCTSSYLRTKNTFLSFANKFVNISLKYTATLRYTYKLA